MTAERRLLILGCGYLGKRILQQAVNSGYQVDALSRNPTTCDQLRAIGVSLTACAELNSKTWHSQFLPTNYVSIVICVGSSQSNPEGYHQSYIDGLNSVSEWMASSTSPIRQAIYTSSISVYGSSLEKLVDEKSPATPESWRGEVLLKSEVLFRDLIAKNKTVLRLGGIYGSDRNSFLKNRQQSRSEDYPLNLIHVDDAADSILKLVKKPQKDRTYNLTDNSPKLRSEIDEAISLYFPQPEKTNIETTTVRKRRSKSNRRICSSLIQRDLDWKPHYTDVIQAIRKMAC